MNKKTICHMGPGRDVPGGMLSVIQGYMSSPCLNEYNHIHIVSASDKGKIKSFISGYMRLGKLIKQNRIDIVHIHMSERGSCFRAMFYMNKCYRHHIPAIIHSHGGELEPWYEKSSSFIRRSFKSSMNKASAVIVLTEGWIDFWKKIVNVDKITVIPNYVKIRSYEKKEYLDDGILKVLFLGQIGELKGIYDLVRAIKILKDQKINAILCVGGDGDRDMCDSLASKLGLSDCVRTFGWVEGETKENLLLQSDCLALPSKYESFGIVLLEGMAHQLPCICGNRGYSKEIIRDGIDGYVVESGSPESIANALKKFIDLDKIKMMGDNAYERARELYSEETVLKKLSGLYSQLSAGQER